MKRSLRILKKPMLQACSILLFMTLLIGASGAFEPASATIRQITWTTRADFENNAATTGAPTTRTNVDSTTLPDKVLIGLSKDRQSTSKISTGLGKIYAIGADRKSIAVLNSETKETLGLIPLPDRPSGMVFNPNNNKLYVGQYNSDQVLVIHCVPIPGNDALDPTPLIVGNGAYPAVYNSVNKKLYILNLLDNTVSVIDSNSQLVPPLTVVAGPYTAHFDNESKKLYVTNKYNTFMSIIDGETNNVENVKIEPPVGLIGGQDPGSVGLQAILPPDMQEYDKLHLTWTHDPLDTSRNQNILFQIRTDKNPEYHGPDGNADSWYERKVSNETTSTVDISEPYASFMELQVKLTSDDILSPILHDVTLSYESYPDLVSTDISGPTKAVAGTQANVDFAVKNEGKETATSTTAGIYLNNVTTGTRTHVGNKLVAALPPGMSELGTVSITIPTSIAPADYFYEICADDANTVAEGIETNNCKFGNRITIYAPLVITSPSPLPSGTAGMSYWLQLEATGGLPTYTWQVDSGSLPPGLSLSADGVISGTPTASALNQKFTVRVSETLSTTVTKEFEISIYQPSLNLTIGGIGKGSIAYNIPSGASCIKTDNQEKSCIREYALNTLITLTQNATTGSTFVGWTGCDSVVNNVCSVSMNGTRNVIATFELPDLVIIAVNSPSSANTEQTITVPVTVMNKRPGIFYGHNVAVYLTNDAGTVNTQIGAKFGGALAYLEQGNVDVTVTIPVVNSGTYFLKAVADFNYFVDEGPYENNNMMVSAPIAITRLYPDLVIIPPFSPPLSLNTEQTITVPVTVENRGHGSSYGHNVAIYLTNDAGTVNTQIGAKFIGALGYLAQGTAYVTVTIPVVNSGTYFLKAVADFNNFVDEGPYENNNTMVSAPIAITRLYPDLIIPPFDPPPPLNTAQTITFPVTVRNQGLGGSFGHNVAVYLTNDAGTVNTQIGARSVGPIAPSVDATVDVTLTIPVVNSGSYFLKVVADFNYFVDEGPYENNNVTVSAPFTVIKP